MSEAAIIKCVGNDPSCPCQDGDVCHYVDYEKTKAFPVVELVRTLDIGLILQILSDPIIFDQISEDGVLIGDITPDVINDYWVAFWAGETVIGVFQIKQIFAQMYEAHIHVLPEYRKQYTQECGAVMWNWIDETFKSGLIYTNVPLFCQNVRDFLLRFEFTEVGILKGAWRKRGAQHEMWIMTRKI